MVRLYVIIVGGLGRYLKVVMTHTFVISVGTITNQIQSMKITSFDETVKRVLTKRPLLDDTFKEFFIR